MSVAQEFPPRSLAAIRPRIPESGAAQTDVLPGARREREGERERGVGAAAGTAGPAGGWSLLPIGDQSVAWCRVSIAEVCCLTVFILLRTVWVVPQPPLWSTSVCLQAPPWWEEKKKKERKYDKLPPPWMRDRLTWAQVDSPPRGGGQLTRSRLRLNRAI